MEPSPFDPFLIVFDRVVRKCIRESRLSEAELATRLSSHPRSFSYWLDGQRKFPAELLARLCVAIGNFELLDFLEQEVGRVAYSIPNVERLPKVEDVRAVQGLIREVGEALQSLSETLQDGIVEKHELDQTVPALDDVIRECARLKHWLYERHRADHSIKFREVAGRRR